MFEASEKIVEEEEDEDYDDDAFEKSFSKAFEPPGASRLKGIVDLIRPTLVFNNYLQICQRISLAHHSAA